MRDKLKVNLKIEFLMKAALVATAFILAGYVSQAQDIVVSEYYNASSPENEWIELIVVEDGASVVNYSLRDNKPVGDSLGEWQDGILFRPIEFWRNLRAGTIIVIRCRGSEEVDIEKGDGYIELGAENNNYFHKVDRMGDGWGASSLSIDYQCETVEILDPFGSHEHSLSHFESIMGDYANISEPKLGIEDICPEGESVSVSPGRNLDEFGGGTNSDKVVVSRNGDFVTKGEPNKQFGFLASNLDFWKKLRTPKWDNPDLSINPLEDVVDLFWNSCYDYKPEDETQGYLITRVKEYLLNGAEHPVNGSTYNKGDVLGSAVVVDNDANTLTTSYEDETELECGESYVYRVYAYRYSADDIFGNGISASYGRGRTYNVKNFAEATVSKKKPAKPVISAKNDDFRFCAGDSVKLTAFAYGGPYGYDWYLNGEEIEGSSGRYFWAKKPGSYKVIIRNEKNCANESDPVEVIELPSPQAEIFADGKKVTTDSTLVLCEGESFLLEVGGGDKYKWFKDGVNQSKTSTTFLASESALYYAAVINDGMECSDTTPRLALDVLNISYSFSKDTLRYYLGKFEKYQDKQITVDNLSTDTLRFVDIALPPGGIFSVSAPQPSNVVPPIESKIYTIRFEPNRSGSYSDSIIFKLPCKNALKKVYVIAEKEKANVRVEPFYAKFDSLLTCENSPKEIKLEIINEESFPVELFKPIVSQPFSLDDSSFPKTLPSDSSFEVVVEFYASVSGQYTEEIIFPYEMEGIGDELSATLQAEAFDVSYSLRKDGSKIDSIYLETLTGCEDSARTDFYIVNTGQAPITINRTDLSDNIYIDDLPINISAGDSERVKTVVVPDKQGHYNYSLKLISSPCDLRDSLVFLGEKRGIVYAFNKKKIEFNLIKCQNPGAVKDTVILFFSGDSVQNGYVADVSALNSPYFSHNIYSGQTLKDTNEFVVEFLQSPLGEYRDTLRLLFKPCNRLKKVPIRGRRTNPELTFYKSALNFGEVIINAYAVDTVRLFNSGSIPIKIENIGNLQAPFSANSDESFPKTLYPDSSLMVEIHFSPLVARENTAYLTFDVSEPCDIDTAIKITGEGVKPPKMKVKISAPKNLSAEPGNRFYVPINIQSLEERPLKEALISHVKIVLKYNQTLLYPKGFEKGFEQTEFINDEFGEMSPGVLKFEATLDDTSSVKRGELFKIDFLALLGDTLVTEIAFDSVEFASELEIDLEKSSGEFLLTGNCAIDRRLLKLDGGMELDLFNSAFKAKPIKIEFEIPGDGRTCLEIYNSLGERINVLLDKTMDSGTHSLFYEPLGVPSGVYFAVLKWENAIRKVNFIIIR